MGYFGTGNGIIGDRQADIIDGAIIEKFGEENSEEIFKNVMKNHDFCKELYSKVKDDFRAPGRTMNKKEFCGHLIFCSLAQCNVCDILDKVEV